MVKGELSDKAGTSLPAHFADIERTYTGNGKTGRLSLVRVLTNCFFLLISDGSVTFA